MKTRILRQIEALQKTRKYSPPQEGEKITEIIEKLLDEYEALENK